MAAVTILPKKCRSHITWWMVLRNASRSKLQQVCSHFHSFYFLFSSASCAFTFLLITLKWELRPRHDLGESSSGCDVPFTAMIKKKERFNYLKYMKNSRLKQLNSMEDKTWSVIKFLNGRKLARLRLSFTRDPWNRASVWSDGKVCMFLSWLEVGSV